MQGVNPPLVDLSADPTLAPPACLPGMRCQLGQMPDMEEACVTAEGGVKVRLRGGGGGGAGGGRQGERPVAGGDESVGGAGGELGA